MLVIVGMRLSTPLEARMVVNKVATRLRSMLSLPQIERSRDQGKRSRDQGKRSRDQGHDRQEQFTLIWTLFLHQKNKTPHNQSIKRGFRTRGGT